MFDPATAASWLRDEDGAPLGRFVVGETSVGGPSPGLQIELAAGTDVHLLVVARDGDVLGRLPLLRTELGTTPDGLELRIAGRLVIALRADDTMPSAVLDDLPSIVESWRQLELASLSAQLGLGGAMRYVCGACGRLVTDLVATSDAVGEVLVEIGLDRSTWEFMRDDRPDEPIRPALLQELGVDYDAAVKTLERGERMGVLERLGRGYRVSALRCPECYRRAPATFASSQSESDRAREPIPAQLRFRVLQRDAFRCRYCGRSAEDGALLHLDHVVPFSKGGATSEDNLVTACERCNLGKSDHAVI